MTAPLVPALPALVRRAAYAVLRPAAGVLYASSTVASGDDAALISLLAGDAFRANEGALRAAFAALPPAAAHALHARLARPRTGDVLAARFARFARGRRARWLAVLGALLRVTAERARTGH